MTQDDLSSDSPAPRGVDLIAGTIGKLNRGDEAATPTPVTIAPTNLITGVSTANPGVVTTTSAHGLVTGQLVAIAGVAGATMANGVWVVTVVSPTTFSIPVSCSGYSSGGLFVPASPGVECSGHGTLRLDLVVSAKSGTSTPTLTGNVYTSFDNGVTDPWREVGSAMTGVTATGTVREVFPGLDRWVCFAAQVSGTTPSFTFSCSGEVV
jgi:hypothetical protein